MALCRGRIIEISGADIFQLSGPSNISKDQLEEKIRAALCGGGYFKYLGRIFQKYPAPPPEILSHQLKRGSAWLCVGLDK